MPVEGDNHRRKAIKSRWIAVCLHYVKQIAMIDIVDNYKANKTQD
jgi:hypothetical protein